MPFSVRRQLLVTGTKGIVELKPLEWYVTDSSIMQTYRNIRISSDWHVKGKEEVCEPYDRYANMMKSFAEYIRGEKTHIHLIMNWNYIKRF